ncbi:unnamed protein product, partial [Cyprideis torosa]
SANLDRARAFAAEHPELLKVGETACSGLCDQGPGALINGHALPNLSAGRLDEVLAAMAADRPLADWPAEWFAIDDFIRHAGPLLQHRFAPGQLWDKVQAMGSDGFLAELEASGHRGRGGAGFPTHIKWRSCRDAPAEHRYVVCNADEGEPGTFKDRVLLSRHFDAVVEGMAICAEVIGARHGYLYLRGEYVTLADALQQRLDELRAVGVLGDHFSLHLHLGAGAYVCGEESALIESLEGKRGIPRNRPPFPVTHGFDGCPTVVNNVESFANAALIADHGASAFRAIGTDQSTGSKLHSVSGDVAHAGIYELPFGIAIHELLEQVGAPDAQAVLVGGPSGTLVPRSQFHRRIGWEDVATGGSLMVFARHRRLLDILGNFSHFFRFESCGFCTPCRAGTVIVDDILQSARGGHCGPRAAAQLDAARQTLSIASHCGLGHSVGDFFGRVLAEPDFAEALTPITGRGMSQLTITIDGQPVSADDGQTVLQAAHEAGVYIPHLCAHPHLSPFGSCRACMVRVNGRWQAACTHRVNDGDKVENDCSDINALRKHVIEMLFVDGNHYCPTCELSGNCQLQALAYQLGMEEPGFDLHYPVRTIDASHPQILLDRDRCIHCGLCERSHHEVDGKNAFCVGGRGEHARLEATCDSGRLADTDLDEADLAANICPVGALLHKHGNYATPIGERLYDTHTIAEIGNRYAHPLYRDPAGDADD